MSDYINVLLLEDSTKSNPVINEGLERSFSDYSSRCFGRKLVASYHNGMWPVAEIVTSSDQFDELIKANKRNSWLYLKFYAVSI